MRYVLIIMILISLFAWISIDSGATEKNIEKETISISSGLAGGSGGAAGSIGGGSTGGHGGSDIRVAQY